MEEKVSTVPFEERETSKNNDAAQVRTVLASDSSVRAISFFSFAPVSRSIFFFFFPQLLSTYEGPIPAGEEPWIQEAHYIMILRSKCLHYNSVHSRVCNMTLSQESRCPGCGPSSSFEEALGPRRDRACGGRDGVGPSSLEEDQERVWSYPWARGRAHVGAPWRLGLAAPPPGLDKVRRR